VTAHGRECLHPATGGATPARQKALFQCRPLSGIPLGRFSDGRSSPGPDRSPILFT
jgi:hypothetical protein